MSEIIRIEAAGVPCVVLPPEGRRPEAPVILTWHLMDPPRTPDALAAALPLALDAWRVHLALPLSPQRAPEGGMEALQEAGQQDAVRNLKVPIVDGAVEEFPAVWAALRDELGLTPRVVGLLGGSDGSSVAAQVALRAREFGLPVKALALVSPVSRMKDTVDALAAMFDFTYPWDDESLAIVASHDLVARSHELADAVGAICLVVGRDDHPTGFVGPAEELAAGLDAAGASVEHHRIDGMGHALAEEPGVEPAPQTRAASEVDAVLTDWFTRTLVE